MRPYLIYDDGIINCHFQEVVEGDILDDAAAHVGARPSLDSGSILGIRHSDVASRRNIQLSKAITRREKSYVDVTFSTMSNTPANWPRLPTEIPLGCHIRSYRSSGIIEEGVSLTGILCTEATEP